MQKLKGIWIPIEIITDEKLSDKEVIILSMILYLSAKNGTCIASNKYILSNIKYNNKANHNNNKISFI